jgi:hypothetical protein
MKRTFQLQIEGKKPERVLDSIKHEVRKYLKRERRRVLPQDTDYWDFDCKFGLSEEASEVVHLSSIIAHIDEISKAGGAQLYVEIIAKAVKRKPRVHAEISPEIIDPTESTQDTKTTDQAVEG